MIIRLLAAVLMLALPAHAAAGTFAIHYLSRADDPRYDARRAYTGLTLQEVKRPVDGARTAMRGARILGRRLGLSFTLNEQELSQGVSAADAIAAIAPGAVLLDLPAGELETAVRELGARDDLILFNIRNPENALRGLCYATLFHTAPSRSMLTDAMAQYLVKQNWRKTLILQGATPADAADAASFARSAAKFGINIVDTRRFILSNNPRERDRTNILLLTEGDYDTIYLADSIGEFGRYVPFASRRARPVIGSEGLTATGWHWTWERYGAPQLNQRFDRQAGRLMSQDDWAAWAAVKSVLDAVVRTGSTDIAVLRTYLLSAAFNLDIYKGGPGSFRPWNRQLRQPILLATHNAVIERAPLDGFLHPVSTLDTLGTDREEYRCRD